jgi:Flp pilus assembly CpaF family ATPase
MLNAFDVTGKSQTIMPDTNRQDERLLYWTDELIKEARARKATEAATKALDSKQIEALARSAYEEVRIKAANDGVALDSDLILRLIGELSGLGPLLELIARDDVEDIALNLGHIYIYTTGDGWKYVGKAPGGMGDGLRVMMDRAGYHPPTPDSPIADAMLQVTVPTLSGEIKRKGVRVNFMMPPASPYGDTITLRVSKYNTSSTGQVGGLAVLCEKRLPPVSRPLFQPKDFPRGNGVVTPEIGNYILSVMVAGGTLIFSGATGTGKTFVAQRVIQEMLNFYPRGSIRLFIVEDSNEIVLNGWDGSLESDTGNIIYTVTRPEIDGGPVAVTMYQLIRAALRSRPHGLIIGEARGAEAWELVRAASTGHGHSAFTIHATSAEQVWSRFLQVVQAHDEAMRLSELKIAQNFAQAVTAVIHIERHPVYGQIVQEVAEVSHIVESAASRPAFNSLFRFNPEKNTQVPTGNRPLRPGFTCRDLCIPESYFRTGG